MTGELSACGREHGKIGLRRALEWLVRGREAKWEGGCRLRCSGVGANENRGEGPFLMASGQLKGLLENFAIITKFMPWYQHLSC